ncbi:MAG: peptidoglycan DL-endopeptidase CwlO [Miltoncostaeaceae bacterium]|nr:peptidoglycan DL-endopeptidase CwlO [Miltoncostaeaceae bacterium]
MSAARRRGALGQALPIALGLALLLVLGALATFAVGQVQVAGERCRTAAETAAVSAARRLRELLGSAAAEGPVLREDWLGDLADAARPSAEAAGARLEAVSLPGAPSWPPTQVVVRVSAPGPLGTTVVREARAEVDFGAPLAVGPGDGAPSPAPPSARLLAGMGDGVGAAAVRDALGFLGTPYVWGGASPSGGFDCSGLVQYVFARHGVSVPHFAASQAALGAPVARDALAPGDVVSFADATGYVHHIGIYVREGWFVHAPHTGDVVKLSQLSTPYYAAQYAGARRY